METTQNQPEVKPATVSLNDALDLVNQILAEHGIIGLYGLTYRKDGNLTLLHTGNFKGNALMMLGAHAALKDLTNSAVGMRVVTPEKPSA